MRESRQPSGVLNLPNSIAINMLGPVWARRLARINALCEIRSTHNEIEKQMMKRWARGANAHLERSSGDVSDHAFLQLPF